MAEKQNKKSTIVGYVVKWNKESVTLGNSVRFREIFLKGAFAESLRNDDVRALWSHNTAAILGRTKNNSLRLAEDSVGLRFELDLPDTTLGNDTYKSVLRQDVSGMSFGFVHAKDQWDNSNPQNIIRTVRQATLLEISCVGFPAYIDSTVSVRSNTPISDAEARARLALALAL